MTGAEKGYWPRFWFAETPLTRLAAFRILILVVALADVLFQSATVLADAGALGSDGGLSRPWHPIFLFELLGLEPIGLASCQWLLVFLIGALCLGIFGLFTRLACLLSLVLFVFWTGLAHSFGTPAYDKVAVCFALMTLPLAPAGARLSLDAIITRFRRAGVGADQGPPGGSPFAAFPLRLTQITVCLGYFFSATAKLASSGVGWANGYTLQGILISHPGDWSALISQNLLLCQMLGIGILAVQLTFPLVLVLPVTRWFYLPAVLLLHLGSWKTLDTGTTMAQWLTLAAFLPLERIPSLLLEGPRRAFWIPAVILSGAFVVWILSLYYPPWTGLFLVPLVLALIIAALPGTRIALVHDGSCGFCRRALAVALALDWTRRIEALDVRDWKQVRDRFPELDEQACIRDMHAVDARQKVSAGYSAYRSLAWRLPLTSLFAWILYLPPVIKRGERIYRRLAGGRVTRERGKKPRAPEQRATGKSATKKKKKSSTRKAGQKKPAAKKPAAKKPAAKKKPGSRKAGRQKTSPRKQRAPRRPRQAPSSSPPAARRRSESPIAEDRHSA
ncbi:MAG: DCC1-like thiol-disulfide oxidoreductase family protein [Planctomycetota bacterium]